MPNTESDPDDASNTAPDLERLNVLTPAAKLLNRRWMGTDTATGVSTIAFEARPEFTNRHGTVQGGFLSAMLDSAAAFAVLATLPAEKTAVTTRLETSFVSPAPIGELVAFSKVESRDGRNATASAELRTRDGIVVAKATATLRIIASRGESSR